MPALCFHFSMPPSWECVADGFGRLEAPCWDAAGQLCFADMRPPGVVQRLDIGGEVTTVAAREHVGGLVPHVGGGLVASGHDVAILREGESERVVLAPEGGWGFNDLATDADGNVFVGMHGERPTGAIPKVTASLWRIGPDGAATRCYDGVGLTNGIGIPPAGDRLYHNDTIAKVVLVSDMTDEGLPTNRRVFHELQYGTPDGMAIDESGCVWVAAMSGGKIVRVTPDGAEDVVLDAPSKWAASVCFGGSDGHDLFVVTFGGAPYDEEHSGGIFTTRVDVAGAPVTPARI